MHELMKQILLKSFLVVRTTTANIQNEKLFHKAEHRKIFLNMRVKVIYNVPNAQMTLES
jgi:hypothetical protein